MTRKLWTHRASPMGCELGLRGHGLKHLVSLLLSFWLTLWQISGSHIMLNDGKKGMKDWIPLVLPS